MKNRWLLLLTLLCLFTLSALAQKGEGPIDPAPPTGHTPDEIIKIVAEKEVGFQKARAQYIYRQDVKVQEFEGQSASGEYRQVADIGFDDSGRRQETVIFAPQNTMQQVQMTRQDIEDIESFFPFVITPDTLPIYDVKYVGRQKVDELNTYVFDLNPVRTEKNKRYFKGRIWIEDQDLFIVKTYGIGYPNPKENQLVPFTTYREQIDGKYWFPTYTSGQDDIKALGKHGEVLASTPVKVVVKYTDYRQFRAKSKITFGDVVDDPQQPKGQQPNNPQTPPPAQNPKQ